MNRAAPRQLTLGASKPVIRFAAGIQEQMQASVGRLPPESYAILGGFLDDPFYVTDFHPMPPLQASSASVTLNAPYIEYYLNTCLLPFGKYVLGAMHSHPGNMNRLSGGVAGSGQGDIPSMRSHLIAAKRMGKPWRHYLAPIVTQSGDDPIVTGWAVTLDQDEPIPADIVWEQAPASAIAQELLEASAESKASLTKNTESPEMPAATAGLELHAIMTRVDGYVSAMQYLKTLEGIGRTRRHGLTRGVYEICMRELRDIKNGQHPLGRYRR